MSKSLLERVTEVAAKLEGTRKRLEQVTTLEERCSSTFMAMLDDHVTLAGRVWIKTVRETSCEED